MRAWTMASAPPAACVTAAPATSASATPRQARVDSNGRRAFIGAPAFRDTGAPRLCAREAPSNRLPRIDGGRVAATPRFPRCECLPGDEQPLEQALAHGFVANEVHARRRHAPPALAVPLQLVPARLLDPVPPEDR